MNETELELKILQRYTAHHDTVGLNTPKCARELDMKEVISDIMGEPANEAVVIRLYMTLAPSSISSRCTASM